MCFLLHSYSVWCKKIQFFNYFFSIKTQQKKTRLIFSIYVWYGVQHAEKIKQSLHCPPPCDVNGCTEMEQDVLCMGGIGQPAGGCGCSLMYLRPGIITHCFIHHRELELFHVNMRDLKALFSFTVMVCGCWSEVSTFNFKQLFVLLTMISGMSIDTLTIAYFDIVKKYSAFNAIWGVLMAFSTWWLFKSWTM